jgi:DNA gyrase subunit B
VSGDRLKGLLDLVASIEQGLRAFGRRNRSVRDFLAMAYKPKTGDSDKPDPRDGLLPLFLVEHEGKEERFYSEKERQDYFGTDHLKLTHPDRLKLTHLVPKDSCSGQER